MLSRFAASSPDASLPWSPCQDVPVIRLRKRRDCAGNRAMPPDKRRRAKDPRGLDARGQADPRASASAPQICVLEAWLHAQQLPKISGKTPLAGAIRYALTRIKRLRPYLDHGILELDNNTAERSMRPIALGRKNYLFMGSEGGGKSAAIAYTLIETAKLNSVDPQAWLTDVLGRIADHKITRRTN